MATPTETYTAPTNGHEITRDMEQRLTIRKPGMDYVSGHEPATLVSGRVTSLEEYFQHKRDEELGRWRSNRNPNLVVYPLGSPGEVTVLDERDGMKQWVTQLSAHGALQEFADVAKEYFDAHPGKKPWHDAKPGEVWVLTVDGHDDVVMVAHESKYGGYRFYLNDREGTVFALDTPSIRAGRRIWPETKEYEDDEH